MELQERYGDIKRRGLGLVAISYDSVDTLKKFADSRGISFPLISDDGSAIINSTSPRVFGIATVIDYARPSAVPGQPPAGRAGGWNVANAAGFIN